MIRADLTEKIVALGIDGKERDIILKKALTGGEVENKQQLDDWVEHRFLPNTVLIEKQQYSKMCVSALKIVSSLAAADYGSSRQRDMGQQWADVTRGYLGEVALVNFLKANWGIEVDLGHDKGKLDEYLPMDVHRVKFPNEEYRTPRIKIGIKATKLNGIWLDIPGNQFSHSDIHIFVKVGVGRDHLFAFFKDISVFKDKVLKIGEDVGVLTSDESSSLFDSLPTFKKVPAYVCGFVEKNVEYGDLPYQGKMGRKHYKVTGWNGPRPAGDKDRIKQRENVPGKVEFQDIKDFSRESGYLFNAGALKWKRNDWDKVIGQL